MEAIGVQLSSCLLLLLAGMVLGGLLDSYRIIRGKLGRKRRGTSRRVSRYLTYLGDLLFWVAVLVLIGPMIYWSTWLELRFYVWLMLFLGLLVYFVFFSSLIILLFIKVGRMIGWFPRKIGEMLRFFCAFTGRVRRTIIANYKRKIGK